MRKSKYFIGVVIFALGFLLAVSCNNNENKTYENIETYTHEDGTYRGAFIDEGLIQVNVQFVLVDGVIREASFRYLQGAVPPYYMGNEEEPYKSVVQQYKEALQYLIGKPLSDHLIDLYEPGDLIQTDVDGYSGSTIRAEKIISSIRDALSRGVYRYTDL